METTDILILYTIFFWSLCYLPACLFTKSTDRILPSYSTDLSIVTMLLYLILFIIIYIIRFIIVFTLAPFLCAVAIGLCIDKYLNK